MHGEGKKRTFYPNTPQSVKQHNITVERKRLTWPLKLSMRNSLLRINYNENVGKKVKIGSENVDKQSQILTLK